MTKNDFIIPAVFGLILFAIYLASLDWISPPSLTVKFYGKPVANSPVMFFNTPHDDLLTDANGRVNMPNTSDGDVGIHINLPDGSGAFLRFPQYGNKTVDYRGPKTISRTEMYYFGIFKTTEESSTYAFTDAQADAIDSKKMTLEEVQEQIDFEIAQRMHLAS